MAELDSYRKITFSKVRKQNVVVGLLIVMMIGAIGTTTVLTQQRQDLQQSAAELEVTPSASSSAVPTGY